MVRNEGTFGNTISESWVNRKREVGRLTAYETLGGHSFETSICLTVEVPHGQSLGDGVMALGLESNMHCQIACAGFFFEPERWDLRHLRSR